MINSIRLELLKLRTTPALHVTVALAFALSLLSASVTIMLTPKPGDPARGSAAQVQHVLGQPSAVVSMAMFILGVLVVAGEYRHRTMLTTFLAEPRRLRVIVAKLVTVGGIGAALAAVTYGVTYVVAVMLYARNGVSQLPVDATRLAWGTVLSGATYGLLGVAVGALTRNTVAAIIAGLVWIQVVEVGILENAVPALAKWLPVGAAQGLTSVHNSELLPQSAAAAVLVAWATGIVLLAGRVSIRRELR
jgi:ABC-type transport system involved in multi-copper enzyme maturation permease subunit